MHECHTQGKWQNCCYTSPRFLKGRESGKAQDVGGSYRKQILVHVMMEGAASVGSELAYLGRVCQCRPGQLLKTHKMCFQPDEYQSLIKPQVPVILYKILKTVRLRGKRLFFFF